MCGIVGVVDFDGHLPSASTFDAMVDALYRRGPDGRGVYSDETVAFGHRRLAVIDPTPSGIQPMVHEATGVVITYNGEVYNFRELRRELENKGHVFHTQTDTEVLLHAYIAWGEDAVDRFEGIFALCFWDPRNKTALLARDGLGTKPLYYGLRDRGVHFASEIKALLEDPRIERNLDPAALQSYLTHCYVAVPYSPLAGILQLRPGEMMRVDEHGAKRIRYWQPTVCENDMSEDEAREGLSAHLARSVKAQMVSDVPLGAFLSGGLDSAAITKEMVDLGGDVHTYSIGFSKAGSYDESSDARVSAKLIGSNHQDQMLDLDFTGAMTRIGETNCDLLADSSGIAVDALCSFARQHVTVALSGDGADEILAGYPTYFAGYLARAYRGVPKPLRGLLARAAGATKASGKRYDLRLFAQRFVSGAEEGSFRDHASWRRYFTKDDDWLLKPHWREAIQPYDAVGDYAEKLVEAGEHVTLLKRMLYADSTYYLPGDMLAKVDRASMRHGLEVRVPFLDRELVNFALSVPTRHLHGSRGNKKHLLRRHLHERGLGEIATRKKRGFNVPVGFSLRGPLYEMLRDMLRAEPFRTDGTIDCQKAEELAERHHRGEIEAGENLYLILVLALFWQHFIKG